MALPNAVTAFQAFSSGIITASTAIEAATPLLSLIALAITGVVAAVNAYSAAQRKATEAAIKSSQDAADTIKNNEERTKVLEDQITKLKEEKKALEGLSNQDDGTKKKIKNKEDEISKRQDNIDKMKEENEQQLLSREAAARSIKPNKADSTGLGWNQTYGASTQDAANQLRENIKNINKDLKDSEDNTGAYKRKLEELRIEYQKQAKEKEKNGQSTEAETETIKALTKELDANKKKYEEDEKSAAELYDILKSGGSILPEQVDWLEKFYNLNDDQIEQLKQGIDVKAQDVEATDKQSESQNTLSEATRNAQEQEDKARQALNDMSSDIDTYQESMDKMKSAVDEYNESGYLSIDNLQSLLSLDSSYLSMLDMENGKLVLNTQAMDTMINALIKKKQEELQSAAITDIWAIANDGAASSANLAAAAAETAGENAKNSGDKAKQGAPGWLEYAAAVEQAAAAAGADKDDETKKRIQQRLDEYKSVAETMDQLGASFGNGGYSSGGGHKYTGSGKSKKSGSGSGSKSKSQKEEYKATIDTLYNYKNALDIAKDSVDKLQDALKNTDNYEEQEKYIRQLISALNDEINKTNDLKAAQTRQINDYINQLRAQGFAIDYNANKNTLYINNMQHLADFSGDTAKSLEKMIDKIQDLNKDNIKLDGSVRDLTKDTKDYNEQLEKLPEEKLKKFKELLEDFQQSRLDQIKNQKEDLEYQKKSDQRIKALEKQIDAIEKQNDELDKQEEINEKILAVEEAKEKLANAQKERSIQVFTGEKFEWQADPDTIKENAEDLRDAQKDLNDQIKQDQLDQLKAEKEALEKSYDDRIEALENFLDEQDYQISKANREGIETFQKLQDEMAKYGLNSAENLSKATTWLNNYNAALANLQKTVNGVLSNSTVAQDGLIYSSATQDRINQALNNIVPVSTKTGLQLNQVDYDALKDKTGGDIYISNISLPNVKDVDDFVEALKDLPRIATSKSSQRK